MSGTRDNRDTKAERLSRLLAKGSATDSVQFWTTFASGSSWSC